MNIVALGKIPTDLIKNHQEMPYAVQAQEKWQLGTEGPSPDPKSLPQHPGPSVRGGGISPALWPPCIYEAPWS